MDAQRPQLEENTAINIAEDIQKSKVESRVGLTKDELLEYANQPFWVRLRNVTFAFFWVVWAATIFVAVGYVIAQPTCGQRPS